jgi:predicted SnoaL-like aldol condensation-catalyzing enzyme
MSAVGGSKLTANLFALAKGRGANLELKLNFRVKQMYFCCINSQLNLNKMTNKEIVKKAITELFNNGDLAALDRYWPDNYIQHNPQVPNGKDALKQFLASGVKLKYEFGLVLEEGDFVVSHARISGLAPKPLIAVDIFRIKEGKLVEHWDVLQEEVPAENTASKNPMFPIK